MTLRKMKLERKVLVVEDEFIVAEYIKKSLERMGYCVPSIASSGEEAIEKAKIHKPDIVLMDIKLEGEMDGIMAADVIKSRYNIPIIFLTAYSDDKILQLAKITEPFGYILKPFRERELRINIEIALYKYEAEKRLKERNSGFSL